MSIFWFIITCHYEKVSFISINFCLHTNTKYIIIYLCTFQYFQILIKSAWTIHECSFFSGVLKTSCSQLSSRRIQEKLPTYLHIESYVRIQNAAYYFVFLDRQIKNTCVTFIYLDLNKIWLLIFDLISFSRSHCLIL